MPRIDRRIATIGAGGGRARLRWIHYAGGMVQAPHAHPITTVTVHVAGAIRERSGREEVESSGLSLTVKPAGVVHSDRFGPDAVRTLQIALEPDFDAKADGWTPALARWRWIAGGPAVRTGIAILRAARDDEPDDEIRELLVAMLDELADRGRARRPGAPPPAWFRRALERLEQGFADRLRVAEVAAAVEVHPVHLTRCFRRWRGCTVTEYLQRLRVREAARLLSGSRRPVAGIAYITGFADQSHLTRTFRRQTGLTPAAYRRLAS